MPFYKTKILNREISLEYEKKDEKKNNRFNKFN